MSDRTQRLLAGLVRIRRGEIRRAGDSEAAAASPARASVWERILGGAARRGGQEGYDLVRHVPIVLWLLLIAYGISLRG